MVNIYMFFFVILRIWIMYTTMAVPSATVQPLSTFARWRPLTEEELRDGEIGHSASLGKNELYSISIEHPAHKPWKSAAAFRESYEPTDGNAKVFESAVSSALPKVLSGASCNFFAYGHSGSGKTHTIIGYDYEHEDQLGVCLAAARRLFDALADLNKNAIDDALGVGFSLFELRKNVAFDLLNKRTECHIRQGADGKTHIRGPTEMLEDGKVRVRPIVKRPCFTYDALKQALQESLGLRAVGSSSVHDQSSRTHAVLELEIINTPLSEARDALIDRQSELVPVGKRATDIRIEEHYLGMIKTPEGRWVPNPERPVDQARIDVAMAEMAEFETRVAEAEDHVASILSADNRPACLGGKFVFVDLAGSEYQQDKGDAAINLPQQTPQERQEGRQINTDLLALKEVIRAFSSNQSRIPFRSSPLTMVLRDHFLGSKNGTSAMIVTLSQAKEQYAATLNSLKYGSLVGAAAA